MRSNNSFQISAFSQYTGTKQIRNVPRPEGCGYAFTTLSNGTDVATNAAGDVVFAQYASGMVARRNMENVLVFGKDESFWLGTGDGMWHRLD